MGHVRALIPAAGYGRRMEELTGGRPKELLTLGPLTLIEHCLRMTIDSGITDAAIVVRRGKEEIVSVLEKYLMRCGRSHEFKLTVLYQNEPKGVADAMSIASDFAGDSPLAVLMPDQILLDGPPALRQMIELFDVVQENVIGAVPFSRERASQFGAVGLMQLERDWKGNPRATSFSPKRRGVLAGQADAGMVKGLIGVIYLPDWKNRINTVSPNDSGELDDTDLVIDLVREKRMYVAVLKGVGFDVGIPSGLSAARTRLEKTGKQ